MRGPDALQAQRVADRVRVGALDLGGGVEEEQRLAEGAPAQRLPARALEVGHGLVGIVRTRPVVREEREVRGLLLPR